MIDLVEQPVQITTELKNLVSHHNRGIILRKEILENCELISIDKLEKVITHTFPKLKSYYLDKKYRIPDGEQISEILKYSQSKRLKYSKETFDCDDFATVLKSEVVKLGTNAVGIVVDISGKHAYNILVYNIHGTLSISAVEPQTDEIIKIGEGLYKAEEGYIIF